MKVSSPFVLVICTERVAVHGDRLSMRRSGCSFSISG